jgi:hypothetical protein
MTVGRRGNVSRDVRVQRLERPFLPGVPFDEEEYALLFVVWAADVTVDEQRDLSCRIVASGCRYAVCTGHSSSSWDDSIDLAAVLAELDGQRSPRTHIMTTWHEEESLLAVTVGGTAAQNDRVAALVAEWAEA